MILLIDNYDSFTYNLAHYLGELGAETQIYRNDQITVAQVEKMAPEAIVLSPGPCGPESAGICVDLIAAVDSTIPILGVCLGHQAIGLHYGAIVRRAPEPVHGIVTPVHHQGAELFAGLPSPFPATRYHSLLVAREGFPQTLSITAQSDDKIIMAIQHTRYRVYGVQFHPESIGGEYGHALLKNFLICL